MAFSIFLRTVYKTKSKINGEIVVKEQFGQHRLYVQNVLQSGGIIKSIWNKPLKKFQNSKIPPVSLHSPERAKLQNILILGLGGGTVVQLIKQYWPEAKIIGLEIDPEIIKVGEKFFGLSSIKNLKIIQANAFDWIAGCLKDTSNAFDLIIVDFYLGKKFPKKAESKKFLRNVKKLLSKNGLAIFNRLRTKEADLEGFEEKLKNHFSSVEKVKATTNLFFLARS